MHIKTEGTTVTHPYLPASVTLLHSNIGGIPFTHPYLPVIATEKHGHTVLASDMHSY